MTATALLTRAEALAQCTAPGQPHELVEQTIAGRRVKVFKHAPRSLRALYEQTATDAEFIVYQHERYSYAQVWAQAGRIGHLLVHGYGVQPGDRVAIAMRNYPEWMLAYTAVTAIGAVAVAVNAHWQADELHYGLLDCGATVLLADRERLERLARAPDIPGLRVLAVRAAAAELPAGLAARLSLADLRQQMDALGEVAMPAVDVAADAPAMILYTSGSTGHPKGVLTTHRQTLAAILSWELDRVAGERMAAAAGIAPVEPGGPPGALLASPLFHVMGLNVHFLSSHRLQRKLVAMYRWDPEEAARLIAAERLDAVSATPAMTHDLVRVAREGRHDLSSLRAVGGGGAARAPEQVRQIDAAFATAAPNTGWGMTETGGIGVGISGADYLTRPASSGRCSAVLELKIVDEAGQAVPAGERGELLVRGASVFEGYWRRPDANAQVFVDGDWFRTGDVALIDDEGFLFIVDRIKDLIIRGGENIGCGAVEAALLLHPQVHEAAVYAVPDERLGEEVGATVHGDPGLDADALRAFLAEHLAAFEVPRHLAISAEPLPRTPSGKILKRRIREAALAGLAPG